MTDNERRALQDLFEFVEMSMYDMSQRMVEVKDAIKQIQEIQIEVEMR